VLYLDANVFIFAALSTKEYGDKAEAVLNRVQLGEEAAVTSALTLDEVFWMVKRNRGVEKAIETAEAILNLPNLEIIAADKETAMAAVALIRKYNLAPRDALHAATAIACGIDFLVTSDAHFSRVKELKVKSLE